MAARKGNRNASAERKALSPLERFLSFCRHDPVSGCVLWTGGQTSGRGHSAPYGSFWFEGARWFAHRWAAKHIHGHAIEGLQVEHYCPHIDHPNTLCVEHVHPIPAELNRELQTLRGRALVDQSVEERKNWIYVQVGILPPPPVTIEASDGVPFFVPPAWLTPTAGMKRCPF